MSPVPSRRRYGSGSWNRRLNMAAGSRRHIQGDDDDHRPRLPYRRRRDLGRRHVLRLRRAAAERRRARAGAAPAALAPRLQPLLSLGVGKHHRPAGERLLHGLSRLRRLSRRRHARPDHAGNRDRHDDALPASLLRSLEAFSARHRGWRSHGRGQESRANPRPRRRQPGAWASHRRRRGKRALLVGEGSIMAITLYDLAAADVDRRFSPFCWRTRMALAHKDLAVDSVPSPFTETEKIAFSGQGKVPVIVDGGKTVFDSWTIADYLDATYPERPALLASPRERALAKFVGAWTDTVLHPGLARPVMADVWAHLDDKAKLYFRESREKRFGTTLEAFCADRDSKLAAFRQSLTPLRATLQAQPYLGGDA